MRRAILVGLLACFPLTLAGCGGCGLSQAGIRSYAIRRPSDDDEPPPKPQQQPKPASSKPAPAPRPPAPAPPATSNTTAEPAAEPAQPATPPEDSPDEAPPGLSPRARSIHNLTRIGAAMLKHTQQHHEYPIRARFDATGKRPLLSWRVMLLPYLGYTKLYNRFNIDEPWDSPQNKALLSEIPPVYRSPERGDETTNYLVPVDHNAAFAPFLLPGIPHGRSKNIEDGAANTIIVLEVSDELAVPWTMPSEFDAAQDVTRMLGKLRHDGLFVVWGDGRVGLLPNDVDARLARTLFTIDSGDNRIPAAQISFTLTPEAPGSDAPVTAAGPQNPPIAAAPPSAGTVDRATTAPVNPFPTAAPPTPPSPTPPATAAAASPTPAPPPADSRRPAPSPFEQREAGRLFDEVYGEKIAGARTFEQKHEIARDLLADLPRLQDDSVGQYVLLERTRTLARDSGDITTALKAVEELHARFEVDVTALRIETVSQYTATSTSAGEEETNKLVLRYASALVRQALEEDNFDSAVKMYEIAVTAARRSGDSNLVRSLQTARKEIDVARRAYDEVKGVIAELGADPSDPAANRVAGAYYCFVKGAWAKGLPLLARCDDDRLRNLAEREIDAPALAADQVELADDWWKFGESQSLPGKRRIQLRAVRWYQTALRQLPNGLQKVKVEVRLKEAERSYGDLAALPQGGGA